MKPILSKIVKLLLERYLHTRRPKWTDWLLIIIRESPPRIYSDETPESLLNLLEGRTEVQVRGRIRNERGLWLKPMTGKVLNVRTVQGWLLFDHRIVTFECEGTRVIPMQLYFQNFKHYARVENLRVGDRVSVQGVIETVTRAGVVLKFCELIDRQLATDVYQSGPKRLKQTESPVT